jgi:hypothetical protein
VLQAGIVREIREGAFTLVFEVRYHAVEAGEERLVNYNRARVFIQQPVLIEEQLSSGPSFVLGVKPIGDAVFVGTREEDRVTTSGSGLKATLDDNDVCPIEDVCLSGLAVISNRKYHVERCLEIAIHYGDDEFFGEVEVQCVHPLDDGETRYGLLGVLDTDAERGLENGLTRMTLEIQQQDLKRISGSS